MVFVKLKENVREFEDDSGLYLKSKEVALLKDSYLRSYTVKQYLMNGKLIVVDGAVNFSFKNTKFYLSSNHPGKMFGLELGRFFVKDLELDMTNFYPKEEFTADVIFALTGEHVVLQSPSKDSSVEPEESESKLEKKEVTLSDLKNMNKDELNDFAATKGFLDEINTDMSKKAMLAKIRELLGW